MQRPWSLLAGNATRFLWCTNKAIPVAVGVFVLESRLHYSRLHYSRLRCRKSQIIKRGFWWPRKHRHGLDHRLRGPPGKGKKKKKKQTPCRICSPSTLPRAPPYVYQLQPTAEIKIWSVHPRLQESIIKHSHWGGLCPIDRRVQPQRHVGTYLLPTASIGTPTTGVT